MKRKDYLSWEEYFMGLAILSAERSKDPSTQVGACIVDENNKIISVGYNGAPIGFDDDNDMTWEREGDFLNTKYAYVCHSELNAILNSKIPVKGCKLYVTLFPCNECNFMKICTHHVYHSYCHYHKSPRNHNQQQCMNQGSGSMCRNF